MKCAKEHFASKFNSKIYKCAHCNGEHLASDPACEVLHTMLRSRYNPVNTTLNTASQPKPSLIVK